LLHDAGKGHNARGQGAQARSRSSHQANAGGGNPALGERILIDGQLG
jgi:hypothetical protein